jgi:hypothetical protein
VRRERFIPTFLPIAQTAFRIVNGSAILAFLIGSVVFFTHLIACVVDFVQSRQPGANNLLILAGGFFIIASLLFVAIDLMFVIRQ